MATKKRSKSNRLTSVHRTFIVQQLACFLSPTETAEAVNEEFGIVVTPQNVQKYDHTKAAGSQCAKKWVELYDSTRKAFLDNIDAHIPEANKAVRIRALANASRAYKGRNNFVGMADMLERIAKEMGNVHTNRREFTGKGGGPIKYQDTDMMDEKEIDAELRRRGIEPDDAKSSPAA